MYIYKKIDNIMENKEKASAFITQKELEQVVGSLSIHEDGEWKQITNAECKGNGCKKVSIDELQSDINKLNDKTDKNNLFIDELKGSLIVFKEANNILLNENGKLLETLERNDAYVKADFEDIQKLKKSNRVGEVIIGFLTTSILIYTIYNLM